MQRHVHLYNAVDVAYDESRRLLASRTDSAFELQDLQFTNAAMEGTSRLDAEFAGVRLEHDMLLHVEPLTDVPGAIPLSRIQARWEPSTASHMIPTLVADIELEPIDEHRTLVSLLGMYQPPLGRVGAAIDRLAMRRVAEGALRHVFDRIISVIVDGASPGGDAPA